MNFNILSPWRYGLLTGLVVGGSALGCATTGWAQIPQVELCPVSPAVMDTSRVTSRFGFLHSGDLLRVVVFRQKDLSGDYPIDSQGRVVIPGLGVVPAAGLDPSHVEQEIRSLLECRGYQADLSVQPQIRVGVLGEVRSPGLLTVEPGVSALQLITLAGGQTDRADLPRTRVIRNGRSYGLDLRAALSGNVAGNTVLNSNDVVIVPRRAGISREDVAFILGMVGTLASLVNIVVTLRHR